MKNYEKYAEEIKKYEGTSFCDDFIIPHIFNSEGNCRGIDCNACHMLQMIWLMEDYEEPEVDWSNVKVDTPILVRDAEHEVWCRRYFSKYVNGVVRTWNSGYTSWTASYDRAWKYAKLADSEKGDA